MNENDLINIERSLDRIAFALEKRNKIEIVKLTALQEDALINMN